MAAVVFFSLRFLVSIRIMSVRIMSMMRFVVLWRADWHVVGHWDFLVDWEFHFFVNDMWSVDWDLDFILYEEKEVVISCQMGYDRMHLLGLAFPRCRVPS